MSKDIPTLYGSLVFSDKVMRNKLPKDVYKALRKTIENGTHLELDVANSVAVAMKEWATENGGYTRMIKNSARRGDGAEVVIIELV